MRHSFGDATLAGAFVAHWCVGAQVETAGGVFQCARTSRSRGWARGCTGRRKSRDIISAPTSWCRAGQETAAKPLSVRG
jgi:hypothetical protein